MTPSEVARLSPAEKLKEAIVQSRHFMLPHLWSTVKHFIEPASLAMMASGIAILVASQAFGVGEIADAAILLIGAIALGSDVFSYLDHLISFGNGALNAKSDAELTAAGEHFAKAVILMGAIAIETALFMRAARNFTEPTPPPPPGLPAPKPAKPGKLEEVGKDPNLEALWSQPKIAAKPDGAFRNAATQGETTAFGEIIYRATRGIKAQMRALDHELVHRFFSPRIRPLRTFRARLNMSAYARSALIRYTEEAMAQTYSLLKNNGVNMANVVEGLKFPIRNGYVTLEQMTCVGAEIGIIWVGAERIRYSVQLLLDGPPESLSFSP